MEVLLEIVAWINISGLLASCLKNPGTHRLQSGKETLFRNNTVITVSSGLHDCCPV